MLSFASLYSTSRDKDTVRVSINANRHASSVHEAIANFLGVSVECATLTGLDAGARVRIRKEWVVDPTNGEHSDKYSEGEIGLTCAYDTAGGHNVLLLPGSPNDAPADLMASAAKFAEALQSALERAKMKTVSRPAPPLGIKSILKRTAGPAHTAPAKDGEQREAQERPRQVATWAQRLMQGHKPSTAVELTAQPAPVASSSAQQLQQDSVERPADAVRGDRNLHGQKESAAEAAETAVEARAYNSRAFAAAALAAFDRGIDEVHVANNVASFKGERAAVIAFAADHISGSQGSWNIRPVGNSGCAAIWDMLGGSGQRAPASERASSIGPAPDTRKREPTALEASLRVPQPPQSASSARGGDTKEQPNQEPTQPKPQPPPLQQPQQQSQQQQQEQQQSQQQSQQQQQEQPKRPKQPKQQQQRTHRPQGDKHGEDSLFRRVERNKRGRLTVTVASDDKAAGLPHGVAHPNPGAESCATAAALDILAALAHDEKRINLEKQQPMQSAALASTLRRTPLTDLVQTAYGAIAPGTRRSVAQQKEVATNAFTVAIARLREGEAVKPAAEAKENEESGFSNFGNIFESFENAVKEAGMFSVLEAKAKVNCRTLSSHVTADGEHHSHEKKFYDLGVHAVVRQAPAAELQPPARMGERGQAARAAAAAAAAAEALSRNETHPDHNGLQTIARGSGATGLLDVDCGACRARVPHNVRTDIEVGRLPQLLKLSFAPAAAEVGEAPDEATRDEEVALAGAAAERGNNVPRVTTALILSTAQVKAGLAGRPVTGCLDRLEATEASDYKLIAAAIFAFNHYYTITRMGNNFILRDTNVVRRISPREALHMLARKSAVLQLYRRHGMVHYDVGSDSCPNSEDEREIDRTQSAGNGGGNSSAADSSKGAANDGNSE
jgi:hypothetical protein